VNVTTVAIHFTPTDPIGHPDDGCLAIGGPDTNAWLVADSPESWEALAAEAIAAANALRGVA
jgi:hypothetical protein